VDALAAETCADLPPSLHPHPLKGDLVGYFAVDEQHQVKGDVMLHDWFFIQTIELTN